MGPSLRCGSQHAGVCMWSWRMLHAMRILECDLSVMRNAKNSCTFGVNCDVRQREVGRVSGNGVGAHTAVVW